MLGALLLNLLGLTATAVAATRLHDRRLAVAALVLLPLIVLRVGPAGLSSAWNPNLVVLAFLATVVSGAAVAGGATAMLPVLVAAGTLAAQSHLALVAPVATVVVFARALRLLAPRAGAGDSTARGSRAPLVVAVVVGVAAWAPVAVEQFTSERGNLARIAAYLAEERPAQSLAATLEFMKDKATIIFSRLASGEVTGEMLNEEGIVVASRSFGIMSGAEYRKILELMQIEHPDIAAFKPIEIAGN